MARRRPASAVVDPLVDLDKKVEILEREMAVQRAAIDRLKTMGPAPVVRDPKIIPARKTA